MATSLPVLAVGRVLCEDLAAATAASLLGGNDVGMRRGPGGASRRRPADSHRDAVAMAVGKEKAAMIGSMEGRNDGEFYSNPSSCLNGKLYA